MSPPRSQRPRASPASHHSITIDNSEICAHITIGKEPKESCSPSTTKIPAIASNKRKWPLTQGSSHSSCTQPTALHKAKRPRRKPKMLKPCDEGDTTCDNYDLASYEEIWKSECLLGVLRELSPMKLLQEWADIKAFIDGERIRLPAPGLLDSRFRYALLTTEWWGDVGCQMCYVETGGRQHDHELRTCLFTKYSRRAVAILDWLERLDIPHTLDKKSSRCSLCEVAGLECKESQYHGDVVRLSQWDVLGGQCERKPIVGRVIAALAAYDDQFLGKWLTKYVFQDEGEDMLQEGKARAWFQQQRPLNKDWYPGLLLAFEYLVLAFYHRQNIKRGAKPLVNFPTEPPEPLYFTYEI